MGDLRNDIERYSKGELSPAEMHELERKALSDPFLADALEGYAHTATPTAELDRSREVLLVWPNQQPEYHE